MKHWIRLAALLMLLTGPATAQEIIYSAYQRYDLRQGDFSVVGKTAGRLYTYHSTSEGFFLDAWNDSMQRTATVVLDFFPPKIYETRFISYPDKIIVLYQSLERGKVIQHAAKLDGDGRLVGNPLNLDSAKTGFFGPNRDYFSSAISDDKHYLAIYAANTKGDNVSISAAVLDDELKLSGRFAPVYTNDERADAGDAMIGNDGTFYLPVTSPVGNEGYASGLKLLSVKLGERQIHTARLPLAENFAASPYLRIDNQKGRIYLGGFFSSKRNGNYEGILYAVYDNAGNTFGGQRMIPFDEQIKNQTGERNTKRAFNNFKTRQLIVKNDGGFVLNAESYYTTVRNTGSPYGYGTGFYPMAYGPFMTSGRSIREYRYEDVLVLSCSGDGNIEWSTFIRKDQYSQEDGGVFSSYSLLNTGGSLGFLYNTLSGRRSAIQLATVDGDGKTEMRSLALNTADDPDWIPKSGKQVSAHELIVPCIRKRQICFVKLLF